MSLLQTANPTAIGSRDASLSVELFTGEEFPRRLLDRVSTLDARSPFACELWWDAWWTHLRPAGAELFLLTVSRGD
jgi:hypothetical protein